MLFSLAYYFWPGLSPHEMKRFSILGLVIFSIIGCYWLLGIVKDVVFFKIAFPESFGWNACQGRLMQPIAKSLSPLILLFCVIIYSKLVDMFEKHKLFYVLGCFYLLIFSTITGLLALRAYSGDAALGKIVLACVGWLSYFSVESFGSLMVALFWSFAVSTTDARLAKLGFPVMVVGAQSGALVGSSLGLSCNIFGGVWTLLLLCCAAVISTMLLMRYFVRSIPAHELVGMKENSVHMGEERGGLDSFFGGLRLLLTRPYLAGVLVCSTAFEIINTIIEYQMKSSADIYPAFAGEAGFTLFLSYFGIATNGFALVMALLGTSYLLKNVPIRFCLLIYPLSLGVMLIGLYGFYTVWVPSAAQILWASFAAMVVAKSLNYTVNAPTRDMMYIPTSKDAKFKAKGWVDTFGGRSVKFLGARVTNLLKHNMDALINVGTILSLGLVGFWVIVALYVGKKNAALIKEGKIVE